MSPSAVFVRILLRWSAILLGTFLVLLHPLTI
jgi:hypothetical protein